MAEILGGEKRGWENIFCTRPLQIAISFYEVGCLCVFLLNFRMFRIGSGRYAGRPTGGRVYFGGWGSGSSSQPHHRRTKSNADRSASSLQPVSMKARPTGW
jgi:hypothetical protein